MDRQRMGSRLLTATISELADASAAGTWALKPIRAVLMSPYLTVSAIFVSPVNR